jgi:Uma2 family endonuclease
MATVAQKPITAEEFFLMSGDPSLRMELVRGEVVTMCRPGFRHGLIQARIARKLDEYATGRRFGRVTTESGLITERGPDTVRGPDVAVWSFDRLPADQEPVGYPTVAADLCVEIISPSDRPAQVQEKLVEYLARGVRMVWVIDPDERSVRVHRSPDDPELFDESATLDGDDVLPGFSCLVADLFA